MANIVRTLARIKADPMDCLGGPQNLNQLFRSAGHVWRERVYSPAVTLGLFMLQVLHGNTAITHLRHLCGRNIRPQSYCDARARLPVATLARVIDQLCSDCRTFTEDLATRWLGRRVLIADATTVTTPDTPVLQSLWPQPSVQQPGCGFPMIKLLGLMDLATGMILQLSVFCLRVHEMSQAAAMTAALRVGDVLLADRGFCSFAHLALLALKQIDAVFRMHQKQIVDFKVNRPHQRGGKRYRRGVPTSRFVRRLGTEDQIVEWIKPADKPQWMAQRDYDRLPDTLLVRELRYVISARGRRTRCVTIATTLLDAMRYPKARIAELYGMRWEIETNFRHLKSTMKMDQLKCKTPEGVLKELLVFMLIYNLVRCAMAAQGARQQADPNRISLLDTLRWLCSRNTATPTRLVQNPPRSGRHCARVKKRRPKEYDLMTKPRSHYIQPEQDQELTI
jgi:Transposase DDE domain